MRAAWALVAVLTAGCAGDAGPKDPQAAVREMFDEYSEGVARADWEQTCGRTAREYVYLRYTELQNEGVTDAPRDCVALMKFAVEHQPEIARQLKDEYEDARFDGADVTGATARVDFSIFMAGDERRPMNMYARRDDDGRWKVTKVVSQ